MNNIDQMKNVVSGVLVVDKPIGLTSHDVVQIIRRGTGIRRAGIQVLLDPRASGVLVVLIGPQYVLVNTFQHQISATRQPSRLGSSTDTYDSEAQSQFLFC
jgi:tRNA pseudouridine55 synthase